jgi:putative hydrolase of the HAD superfamily
MVRSIHISHDQPRAILLDLDDTIVTDEAVSEKTWRAACRRFAPFFEGISADMLYTSIREVATGYWRDDDNHRKGRLNLKDTRRELVRVALRKMGFNNNDKLADRISDTYTADKELAIAPIPGAIETLHCFKEMGLHLALITNGGADTQCRKISRFGLDAIFDFVLIEGEFGLGKPHPSVFTTAMEKLNVNASETWMVGDDLQRDIAGAQRLGIYSIWVDWRGVGLPLSSVVKPNHIVRTVVQLAEESR